MFKFTVKKFAKTRKVLSYTLLTLIAIAMATNSNAQQVKVATGATSGTYSTMFKELNGKCSDAIPMIETLSTGSMDNINKLTGNEVNAAFTQTDVLYYRARTEDLGNIKTLFALHPEEVHLVALTVSKVKVGGVMGVGAKPAVFSDISQLNGFRVGAAGGSFVTAQVIRLQSEIGFQVVQFEKNDQLLTALKAGEIEAALMVGGAPLPIVKALTNEFKLLAIPEAVAAKLKAVYRPAMLNYNGMGQGGSVPTVATDALLVTREYKTEKMVAGLAKLRQCFYANLDEMKETTGFHPKWSVVDANNHGKWNWYELPVSKPITVRK